ncbi:MAG: (Fe-S)-binding protein [Dactylosporangium sp.]|nr:(Fe-S)-binding protein [Dactylosporangium sp.]NNJ62058.1 (Fe-S)-binding protein [Dactylosporangium sp.]
MPLPIGDVIGILSDNLRLRGSVLPIPPKKATRWARGLGLPRGGATVLYTGQMYQLIPYIELAVRAMERVESTPLAALAPLGRRVNRLLNLTPLALRPLARTRAPYDRVLGDIAHLLRQAGVGFGYLYDDDLYSGALAYDLGLDEVVARHAHRVVEAFRRNGVSKIITVDPHTTTMLRTVYPTLVDGFDLRVRSYLEVLAERLPPADAPLGQRLALHDSCVLARAEGVVEQPRALLAQAGVTVCEPAATGRLTWCCGGPVEALYPARARATAARRVEQLRAVAPAGVTMCPLCLVNLRKAAADELPLRDISQVLREAHTIPTTPTLTTATKKAD